MQKHTIKKTSAQVTLEYTFCIVIILLLIYGAILVLRWAGVSLANRRIAHEATLTNSISEGWIIFDDGPLKQLQTNFHSMTPMNLVFNGW